MTIRFEYVCKNCQYIYVEQRGEDEPDPYITKCLSCNTGDYEEYSVEQISAEPERVPAPIFVVDETIEEIITTE